MTKPRCQSPLKLRITLPDSDPFEVEVAGEEATLGRSPDCDVVVKNPFVSKTHLHLLRGLVAVDRASANGTFLEDGMRVEGAVLVTGGRVTIGKEDVLVEVLDEEAEGGMAPEEAAELRELRGRTAGLEHELEELRNENAYLRLQVESMRKANATRAAVEELSKAQLMKQGKSVEEFERLQQSYTEVLQRLQTDIDDRLKQREGSR